MKRARAGGAPRIGLNVLLALSASSCASDEGATRDEGTPAAEQAEAAPDDDEAEPPEDDALALPESWDEVPRRLEFLCPGPLFELAEPSRVTVGEHTFERLGSTWRRTEPWTGPLVIGVLGAPKDASENTRTNIRRAVKRFTEAGADLVVVNGDLAEDEWLKDVMRMLGEEVPLPVAVHAGNIEWAGAFTGAFTAAHEDHPQLINMNWVRHLDLGGVHVVSLPGYHDHRFTRAGACRYSEADLAALRETVRALRARGEPVVLTAHGPPRSEGYEGIDFAHEAGNVGDERLTSILLEEDVRVGLFGHILEAGGRATADLEEGAPLRFPVKEAQERLYLNAGSAGAYPWTMHGGKVAEGQAFIVTVDDEGARVARVRLR